MYEKRIRQRRNFLNADLILRLQHNQSRQMMADLSTEFDPKVRFSNTIKQNNRELPVYCRYIIKQKFFK